MGGSKDKNMYGVAALIIIIVISLWVSNGVLLFYVDERGSYGDMFGVVNSLFSGLAFAGIIFAILLQRRELELQRKELELTRNEFTEQNKTLKLQRFENTFFQMLKLHADIVNQMQIGDRFKGRNCFSWLNNKFREHYSGYIKNAQDETIKESIANSYQLFYDERPALLGHYFRNLYHILKFVDKFKKEIDEKQYSNIIRAQLSSYELVLLFYNSLSKHGEKKFKPLIEEYEFFENMDFRLLVNQDLMGEYEDSAFGENA